MTHLKTLIVVFIMSNLMVACQNGNSKKSENLPIGKEDMGRDSWQKPELVISALGDISDKTIADIGAGTGYFTFRLAFSAKKVIAIDIDQNMVDLIDLFKRNLPEEIQQKIETKMVKPDNPLLTQGEVDIAVIINTLPYITQPVDYLRNLAMNLSENGRILIVDFKKKFLAIDAPPQEDRLSEDEVMDILSKAGYQEIEINSETLSYQYIILANK